MNTDLLSPHVLHTDSITLRPIIAKYRHNPESLTDNEVLILRRFYETASDLVKADLDLQPVGDTVNKRYAVLDSICVKRKLSYL